MATPLTNAAPPPELPARPRTFKGWQIAVFVLVAGLLAVVALQMRRTGPLAAGRVGQGERAPDFTLQTFDGQTLALSDLRGRVVVINFWASWCLPCAQEAADLENTWRQYQAEGVLFLGVDYVDTETEARDYLKRWNITYPNGPDLQTQISYQYRVRAVPETFVVDQEGTLAAVIVGPTTQAQLQAAIEPLLAP